MGFSTFKYLTGNVESLISTTTRIIITYFMVIARNAYISELFHVFIIHIFSFKMVLQPFELL